MEEIGSHLLSGSSHLLFGFKANAHVTWTLFGCVACLQRLYFSSDVKDNITVSIFALQNDFVWWSNN